ncbi:Crinkler (CRN) [Phytophthora megakarya]|uniref:Crinkler (CRN) n=1 Tax=Phytophthora megakarya TaxID=4795 RepID=A0A225VLI2_9STRA|nr:Crinkler (CRN) [Phytophthora megakarya]
MPQFGGFQMTVGKKHDIKDGAADDLAKLGQVGNRLFFLLPPLYYEKFTKKTPQTIKQFGIRIPYPDQVN